MKLVQLTGLLWHYHWVVCLCTIYRFIIALNPECSYLGPIRSLESLPFEDYISVIECQPDLIGGNYEQEQGLKVRCPWLNSILVSCCDNVCKLEIIIECVCVCDSIWRFLICWCSAIPKKWATDHRKNSWKYCETQLPPVTLITWFIR